MAQRICVYLSAVSELSPGPPLYVLHIPSMSGRAFTGSAAEGLRLSGAPVAAGPASCRASQNNFQPRSAAVLSISPQRPHLVEAVSRSLPGDSWGKAWYQLDCIVIPYRFSLVLGIFNLYWKD